MKLRKIINLSLLSFLFTTSIHSASFHYYAFKKAYTKQKEAESRNCYLCPKEIRESMQNKVIVINGRNYVTNGATLLKPMKKISYAERKYGSKIKYKNHLQILKESRAKDSTIAIGIKYAPYTTTVNNNQLQTIDKTVVYNPPSIFKHNDLGYTLNLMTRFPTQYFGFRENVPTYYLETKLGSMLDMFLEKDFLEGRTGRFYLMVGAGLRINFNEGKDPNFIKPMVNAKAGVVFTENLSLWIEGVLRSTAITEGKIQKENSDNIYELSVSLGWRF